MVSPLKVLGETDTVVAIDTKSKMSSRTPCVAFAFCTSWNHIPTFAIYPIIFRGQRNRSKTQMTTQLPYGKGYPWNNSMLLVDAPGVSRIENGFGFDYWKGSSRYYYDVVLLAG